MLFVFNDVKILALKIPAYGKNPVFFRIPPILGSCRADMNYSWSVPPGLRDNNFLFSINWLDLYSFFSAANC